MYSRYFRSFISFAVAASVMVSAAGASAEPLKRRTIIQRVPGAKEVLDYLDAVKRTNGRRLISRPVDRSALASPRSIWFHTPDINRGLLIKALEFVPMKITEKWPGGPYELTPLRTLESVTWGRFTERAFGTREQFSGPFKFVILVAAGTFAYFTLTNELTRETADNIFTYIDKHKAFYDFFLTFDYRCNEIRQSYLDGDLSAEEARFNVYQLQLIYVRWFMSRSLNIHRPAEYLRRHLVNFDLFRPLKDFVANGLKPTEPGFAVDKRYVGPLSDAQVEELFAQQDELAIKQEYITRLVHAPYNFVDGVNPDLFTADIRAEIMDDPFTQELLQLRDTGQIGVGDLVYGLQENETWKTEFEHYATLHIEPLQKNSNTPVSLGDIQKKIMAGVLSRATNPLDIE